MPGLHVPLDVDYADDDKIIDAGPMAELLYVRAIAFAKKRLNDGRLRRSQLVVIGRGIPNAARHAATLVEVGLWTATDDGWQITAWLKRNKSAARIVHDTEAKRTKSVMGNHERWHVKAERYDPTCELCNPPNDPRRDPTGDPRIICGDSTESESETQPEAETESSSSPGTTTDDDFHRVLELITEAQVRAYRPNRPRAYAMTVRTNTIAEDGDVIRRLLAEGSSPEAVALFVLGHGISTETARSAAPSGCPDECPLCNGVDFIVDIHDTRTKPGLLPCPNLPNTRSAP